MALDRSKAYEFDNGYIGDDGVWVTSGSVTPTHSANFGDRYYKTNGTAWRNDSSPTPGTDWVQVPEANGGSGTNNSIINFTGPGTTTDKWLGINGESTSDDVEYMLDQASTIIGLVFTNAQTCSTDIEIYKNGSLFFTWGISSFKSKYKTNGLSGLTFAQGDTVSLFMKDAGGTSPKDPAVYIRFKTNIEVSGEGGI